MDGVTCIGTYKNGKSCRNKSGYGPNGLYCKRHAPDEEDKCCDELQIAIEEYNVFCRDGRCFIGGIEDGWGFWFPEKQLRYCPFCGKKLNDV